MHCTDDLSIAISKNLKFGLFSPDVSPLIYYSHFIAIVIAIMLCVILIKNIRKNNLSYTLVVMMGVFVFMALLDLLLWTQTNSKVIMFLWSTWILSFTAIFLLCFNFIFKFTNRRIIAVVEFIFVPIFFVVIALLSVTEGNLQYFDINACAAAENSVMIGTVFIISFIFLTIIMLRGISCFGYEDIEQKQRRVGLFIAIGLGLFLLVFAGSSYYASLANFFGAEPDTFMLEQYAYFGMPILGIFLTFVIVRYKAFDIKLLATQALIWTLIILVGSQFFFIRNPINYVLNGITFVGAIISGVLIVRSVKRVDAQREELALANQEQETLVHFITHQIKGYFTKSRNIFDTLTDMENVPEGAQRLISEGLRSDKEGVELVENILNAANLKTGKMQFKDEKGSLDQMIKKLVDDMTPLATAKNLKLNFYCSTPVQYNADTFRLKDLFKNLISNAINYTFEGGITIYLNKKSDYAEFIIKDTGVGLTEDDKRRLFTSGGRGAESVKYNVSSTGYGLYIAKKVVDYYHGRIWAESEGRNKGTTFVVTLPLEK